jgi:hypothetical protein
MPDGDGHGQKDQRLKEAEPVAPAFGELGKAAKGGM